MRGIVLGRGRFGGRDGGSVNIMDGMPTRGGAGIELVSCSLLEDFVNKE